jgi:molybdopterin-containing oxidoreductase family membrane subunit
MARRTAAGVLGVFAHADVCARAIGAVRQLGANFHVYSPTPDHHLAQAIGQKVSPLGYITLIGALVGAVSGFSLAAYATMSYRLTVWGKPLWAWLPWLVIGFEFTILFGCLTNFITMILMSGLPRLRTTPGYDPRFSVDKYGIFVRCGEADRAKVKAVLHEQGAVEVHEHA